MPALFAVTLGVFEYTCSLLKARTHAYTTPKILSKILAGSYGPDAVACGDAAIQTVSHRVKRLKKHYITCGWRAPRVSLPSPLVCVHPRPRGSQAGRVHPTQPALLTAD